MLTEHIPQNPARILIVGGGIAGTKTAALLKSRLKEHAAITLVSDQPEFEYKPDRIAFGKSPVRRIPLEKISARYGIRIARGSVAHVDPDTRYIRTNDDSEYPYDYLILATGAVFDLDSIPGIADHVWPFWRARDDQAWESLMQGLLHVQDTPARLLLLLSPGNGCPDPMYYLVETANAYLIARGKRQQVEIVLATTERYACELFRADDAWIVEQYIERAVDRLYCQFETVRLDSGSAIDQQGREIIFDRMIAAPPQKPGLHVPEFRCDSSGFPIVSPDTHQVPGYPDIYIVGDLAAGITKQAYQAVRHAQIAATDISNRILGLPRKKLVFPQRHLVGDNLEAWQRGEVFRTKNRVC